MNACLSLLYRSPSVKILDYNCFEPPRSTSAIEYATAFEMTYTRTGRFRYRGSQGEFDIDNTTLLLWNAKTEHRISHDHKVRDTCTIFEFPESLLREAAATFWQKGFKTDEHFVFPKCTVALSPRIDYLHSLFQHALQNRHISGISLKLDELAMEWLEEIFRNLYRRTAQDCPVDKNTDNHLETVERAKNYILQNFDSDLSLRTIARNAYISEFHFTRIFKSFTHHTPHQYLLEVRLHHAARLLQETTQSVTEICFASGFNNYPHFISSFSRRYRISPLQFRKQK